MGRLLPLIFLLFAVSCAAFGQLKDDESEKYSSSPEQLFANRFELGEELILTVQIDRYIIGELPVVVLESGIAFDFESYVAILEFFINLDEIDRTYKGWYINENNDFSLNILSLNEQLSIYSSGREIPILASNYTVLDDYLYIKDNVLSDAFGISHEYEFNSLELIITSEEPLPLQQRIARKSKLTRGTGSFAPKFVQLQRSYGLFSPQVLDLNVSSIYRKNSDDFSSRYSIAGARDIALVHTNFFFTGNQDDLLDDARITLSKESLDADLLGPLKASRVEIGDLRPVRQGREASSNEARGVRVSSQKFRDNTNKQFVNIEGNIQQGWDAELYRNGILLDRELSITSSRYSFVDVPLIFGLNQFEIIMYGPQGQVLVDKLERLVDQQLFSNQGFTYDMSLTQSNKSFLGVRNIVSDNDNYNFSSQFSLGLTDKSGIQLGMQREFGGEGDDTFLINGGINAIVFDSIIASAGFTATDNTESIDLTARGRALNQSISSSLVASRAKKDENSSSYVFNMQSVGSLRLFDTLNLPMQNQIRLTDVGNTRSMQLSNRLGYNARKFSMFNALIFNKSDNGQFSQERLSGSLSFQKPFGKVFMRGAANYNVDSGIDFTSYGTSLSWNLSNAFRARLDISHQVETENTTASLQLGWINTLLELNTRFSWSDNNSWQGGLSARMSLSGQDSRYNAIETNNRGMTNSGAIAVRVFLDNNNNNVFDKGDEPLPEIEVSAVQAFRRAKTNEKCIATITNVSDKKLNDIIVNTDTLPDPYMVPKVDGISIRFRAGIADNLDFPVTLGTDIEGIVELQKNDTLLPVKSLNVLLKDRNGNVVDQVKTAFDGYYFFEKAKVGAYWITINEADAGRMKSINLPSIPVTVKMGSEYITDVNMVLKENPNRSIYLASLGEFKNNKLAQSYLNWLENRNPETFPDLFILNNKDKYIVAATASALEDKVEAHCAFITLSNRQCVSLKVSVPTFTPEY